MSETPRIDSQAATYKNDSPTVLRDQLNECWTQLRTFKRAVADRDRSIDQLTKSMATRDQLIVRLRKRLRFARVRIAFAYSIIGAAVAKTLELVVVHFLLHGWGR